MSTPNLAWDSRLERLSVPESGNQPARTGDRKTKGVL